MSQKRNWKSFIIGGLTGGLLLVNTTSGWAAPVELSIEDSVVLALKNNPTLKIALNAKAQAEWAIKQSQAGNGLSLVLDHTSERYYNPASVTAPESPFVDLFTNSVVLSLPVYTGGKVEGQVSEAKSNLKIAGLSVTKTKEQLRLDTTTDYFSVLQTRNLLQVNQETVDNLSAHLKVVQAQYEIGTIAKTDLLSSQVALANAQDALTKAQNAYELAVATLGNEIGLSLDTEIKLNEDLKYEKNPATLSDSVQYGLAHRPEIISAQASVDVAKAGVQVARSTSLPTVALNATDGWKNDNFPGTENHNWLVSATVSLDVFDSGLTKSQVAQATIGIDTAEQTLKQEIDTVSLDVRSSFLSMREAEKRIDTSKVAVDQAQENLMIDQVRYNVGAGTNLDVLDAQLALTTAKTNYIQALYDYNTGKANLDKAMGIEAK